MLRSILFVCTANICRSPTAEGVFRARINKKKPGHDIEIASAGTHDYHVGKPPFPSAVEAAKRRGYDITGCVSRRIQQGDFEHFDLILCMDRANMAALKTVAPTRYKEKIELLLDYSEKYHGQEVPDPYGGDDKGFEKALDMIEDGCRGLVKLLAR